MGAEIVSLICLLGSSLILSAGAAALPIPERIVRFFMYFAIQLVISGYLVSLANRLNDMAAWTLLHFAFLASSAAYFRFTRRRWPTDILRVTPPDYRCWKTELEALPLLTRICLAFLAVALLFTSFVNVIIALNTAPHNWDSMTYHLARMGYYLQDGNLKPFVSNYHCQVIYPNSSVILQAYFYLISGRNDHWTQIVQFMGYVAAIAATYGSSRLIGAGRVASAVAALTFGLLPNILMQSNTTQDDLLLASFVSCAVYFLLSVRAVPRFETLWLATASCALAVATKFSGPLLVPVVAALAILALPAMRLILGRDLRQVVLTATALAGTALLLAVPSGYWDNWVAYGNPFGPPGPRSAITLKDEPLITQVVEAGKNVIRYATESLSFEGLPPTDETILAQKILRIPVKLLSFTPLNLDRPVGRFEAFRYYRNPHAHEDMSSSGVVGFGLFLPAILAGLIGIRRNPAAGALAIGAVGAYILLCWATVYDPWQGRRLTTVAAISAPAVSVFAQAVWDQSKRMSAQSVWRCLLQLYMAVMIALSTLTGTCAVLYRENANLLPLHNNAFYRDGRWLATDRNAMMTRNRPDNYEPIVKFNAIVPPYAVVAVALQRDEFEYPLFGEKLTRTLIPINPFTNVPPPSVEPGLLPIPPEAEFLVYFTGYYDKEPGDIDLGADWHLRRLKQGT